MENQVKVDETKRTIRLYGQVNLQNTQEIITGMQSLESKEPRDGINFYISSFGGNAHDLISIYDVMQSLECDVNTIGVGKAQSAGCYLLMSGTGKRIAYPNTRIMMHGMQASYPYQSLVDNGIRHKENKKIDNIVAKIVSKHTGKKLEKVKEDMERSFYMSAEEAKKYGIIDKVKGD